MGNNALLNELKETPVEYLQELGAPPPEVLNESDVMNLMGNTEALAPEDTQQEENPAADTDTDTDTDIDPDEEEEADEENEDQDQEEEDHEEDPEAALDPEAEPVVDPDEPTAVAAENFFTPKQIIGLLDKGVVTLEHWIFKLADIDVKKADLYYTAKDKKLLEAPLAKMLKKYNFVIKSPLGGFLMTFIGLEFAKISGILMNDNLDKKHQAELAEKDQQIRDLLQQQYYIMQHLQQYQQYFQQNGQPVTAPAAQPDPAAASSDQEQGPQRNNRGQFTSNGQAKRKKGVLTRKPGETRGRKPKQPITIPLNNDIVANG